MLIIGNIVYYICIAVKYHMKISDIADALVYLFNNHFSFSLVIRVDI